MFRNRGRLAVNTVKTLEKKHFVDTLQIVDRLSART